MAGLSAQTDPVLTISGPAGTFTFQYFEIPEFVHYGGPFQAVVHKQPGGTRQVDSMGPDPGPIHWDGIMLTANGLDRTTTLYALYEAGDKVTVNCRAWTRTCIISDLKIHYRAVNYIEYTIELTEVINAANILGSNDIANLNSLLTKLQDVTGPGGGGLG